MVEITDIYVLVVSEWQVRVLVYILYAFLIILYFVLRFCLSTLKKKKMGLFIQLKTFRVMVHIYIL